MVQHAAPTFLKCWALIALALIFHFQQDDHCILLDVMAHVETDIYPFQVALWHTYVMFPKVVQSHVLPFESLVVQYYSQMQSCF
jgi:galactokinase